MKPSRISAPSGSVVQRSGSSIGWVSMCPLRTSLAARRPIPRSLRRPSCDPAMTRPWSPRPPLARATWQRDPLCHGRLVDPGLVPAVLADETRKHLGHELLAERLGQSFRASMSPGARHGRDRYTSCSGAMRARTRRSRLDARAERAYIAHEGSTGCERRARHNAGRALGDRLRSRHHGAHGHRHAKRLHAARRLLPPVHGGSRYGRRCDRDPCGRQSSPSNAASTRLEARA